MSSKPVKKSQRPASAPPRRPNSNSKPSTAQEQLKVSNVATFRFSNLDRDQLLEEFSKRFQKIRNALHERNEQCNQLATEIQRYKRELVEVHNAVVKARQTKEETERNLENIKQQLHAALEYRKRMQTELADLRVLKQQKSQERDREQKKQEKLQDSLWKLQQEHKQLEQQGGKISKLLQETNFERLKYKKSYFENKELSRQHSLKLESLRNELRDMKTFVHTSMEHITTPATTTTTATAAVHHYHTQSHQYNSSSKYA